MAKVEERTVGTKTRFLVRYRDAERKQRARTFVTRDAAERWLVVLEAAGPEAADAIRMKGQASGPGEITVAKWVANHIDSLTGITDGTRSDYRVYLKRDIAGTPMGALPLSSLTREAVERWVNGMEAKGLAGKSIRNRHSLLSAAMTRATRDDKLAKNPCVGVRMPRQDSSRQMRVLDREEQRRLLEALPDFWRPLVFTLLRTGLRWSEATALEIGDVHLDTVQQTLRIRQAWKHTNSKAMVKDVPKSARGNRSIAINADLADVLRALCIGRPRDAEVFTAPRGGVVRQSTFHEDVWTPALKRAGIEPRPRIHDLRHTFASSMLLSRHMNIYELSRHLGHESITTTTGTYGSLMPDTHDNTVRALDASFDPLSSMTTLLPALRAPTAERAALPGQVIEGHIVEDQVAQERVV